MNSTTIHRLICVPPDKVAVLWPAVLPMIEAAYAKVDEFIPDDMLAALGDGKLLLWISAPGGTIVAALVTALVKRPSGLSCKLMACGGTDMATWLSGHRQIESYARAEGCVKLYAEGRPAWSRVLPGYETKRVVLEKII